MVNVYKRRYVIEIEAIEPDGGIELEAIELDAYSPEQARLIASMFGRVRSCEPTGVTTGNVNILTW